MVLKKPDSKPNDAAASERIVRCPGCGGASVYAAHNLFRPFCSERCKSIDMGAWASEAFAVPAQVEQLGTQPLDD